MDNFIYRRDALRAISGACPFLLMILILLMIFSGDHCGEKELGSGSGA
jgi:hypothetical protein